MSLEVLVVYKCILCVMHLPFRKLIPRCIRLVALYFFINYQSTRFQNITVVLFYLLTFPQTFSVTLGNLWCDE